MTTIDILFEYNPQFGVCVWGSYFEVETERERARWGRETLYYTGGWSWQVCEHRDVDLREVCNPAEHDSGITRERERERGREPGQGRAG